MRYMILLRASAVPAAGGPPEAALHEALAAHRAALSRAGVLLDAADLQPPAFGWRLRSSAGVCAEIGVADDPAPGGPVAGYLLMQVRSREEARVWSERFVLPVGAGAGCEIEVRPLREPHGA